MCEPLTHSCVASSSVIPPLLFHSHLPMLTNDPPPHCSTCTHPIDDNDSPNTIPTTVQPPTSPSQCKAKNCKQVQLNTSKGPQKKVKTMKEDNVPTAKEDNMPTTKAKGLKVKATKGRKGGKVHKGKGRNRKTDAEHTTLDTQCMPLYLTLVEKHIVEGQMTVAPHMRRMAKMRRAARTRRAVASEDAETHKDVETYKQVHKMKDVGNDEGKEVASLPVAVDEDGDHPMALPEQESGTTTTLPTEALPTDKEAPSLWLPQEGVPPTTTLIGAVLSTMHQGVAGLSATTNDIDLSNLAPPEIKQPANGSSQSSGGIIHGCVAGNIYNIRDVDDYNDSVFSECILAQGHVDLTIVYQPPHTISINEPFVKAHSSILFSDVKEQLLLRFASKSLGFPRECQGDAKVLNVNAKLTAKDQGAVCLQRMHTTVKDPLPDKEDSATAICAAAHHPATSSHPAASTPHPAGAKHGPLPEEVGPSTVSHPTSAKPRVPFEDVCLSTGPDMAMLRCDMDYLEAWMRKEADKNMQDKLQKIGGYMRQMGQLLGNGTGYLRVFDGFLVLAM
ncbi:hypothetical protein CPB84DRAFT_1751646 [Gymnopilus junonius]|uniref:Uncharacterized protein n=1 Tax=Gymnopilus junonius TaxID=109634 RepID=A0A9P5TIK3_GYMJU|nr:hypothetical protein CPB84DRAFT_1751646 [Gymnopilus junonius]